MARPSPRTQGVDEEGETFQKYGTQQLKFVAPVVYGTPYQGVTQINTGKTFKMITTAPVQAVKGLLGLDTGTVFSQRIIAGKTGATPVGASYVPPPATPVGEDCGWFGEKCWGKEKENGEDCGWFGEKCWFKLPDWDLGWVKIILVLIGIGIFLWLLRPLFGFAKSVTEVSKSAVTRVNGLK